MGVDEPLASTLDPSCVRRPARHRHRYLKRSLLATLVAVLIEAVVWSPGAGMVGGGVDSTSGPLPIHLPLMGSPTPAPSATPGPGGPSSTRTPTPGSAGTSPPAGQLSLQLNDASPGPAYLGALNGVEGMGGSVFDRQLQQWSAGVPQLLSPLHLHFARCCQPVNPQYCWNSSDCTYHWNAWQQSQADVSPAAAVAAFRQVSAAGDTPMFIINVDRGTTDEAAGFVRYVNVTLGDHVVWWEIGNEENGSAALAANLPSGCSPDGTSGSVYGCVVHQYAQAMRAVDPSIKILANYDGGSLDDLLAAAGPDIDAFDVHQYPPPADPYTTTFTGDGQTQSYSATMNFSGGLTEVTLAAWVSGDHWNGVAPPALHLSVDGRAVQTSASGTSSAQWTTVTRGAYAPWAQAVVGYALLKPGTHQLTVEACSADAVTSLPVSCSGSTMGKWNLELHGLTWALPVGGQMTPSASQVESRSRASGCFGDDGYDIDVDTSWPYPTQVASSTLPWRLSASDYDLAFAAGYADFSQSELEGPTTDAHSVRERLDAYNAAVPPGASPWHGSLVIGEYATFGGCAAKPRTVTESMVGAMGDALNLVHLMADATSSTYPVAAASHFGLDSVDSRACIGWVVANTTTCAPESTPYLGAEGTVLSLPWSLSGSSIPATVLSGPVTTTGQLSAIPSLAATPLVRAVAFQPGATGTVQVAVINLSATQSFSLPIWDAGHVVAYQSSRTVAADPSAYNTGSSQSVVVNTNALSFTNGGNWTTVTLPPFSISVITVSVA
jgi:hypothetical protein